MSDWPGPVPPEWEDPAEDELPSEADEAQLAEVSAYLASVPEPVLPDAVAARISAVLVAEVAARAGTPSSSGQRATAGGSGAVDGPRPLGPPRSAPGRRRRGLRVRPLVAVSSVAVCLLLAGLGYGLSHGSAMEGGAGTSAGPALTQEGPAAGAESAAPGEVPAPGSSAAASSAQTSAAPTSAPLPPTSKPVSTTPGATSSASKPVTSGPAPSPSAPAPTASASGTATAPMPTPTATPTMPTPSATGNAVSFSVVASGTSYQKATLAAQVQAVLNGPTLPGSAPSATLRGCVSSVTGGQSPRLVDDATYQGSAAYVIASSSEAWVVKPGCTAANPELIVSVALAG